MAVISHSLMRPAGRGRAAVRGFWASRRRSMMRLADMARVRADAIATVIQRNGASVGRPSEASIMPRYAKGRAKTVCSNRMESSRRRIFPGTAVTTLISLLCWLPGLLSVAWGLFRILNCSYCKLDSKWKSSSFSRSTLLLIFSISMPTT